MTRKSFLQGGVDIAAENVTPVASRMVNTIATPTIHGQQYILDWWEFLIDNVN